MLVHRLLNLMRVRVMFRQQARGQHHNARRGPLPLLLLLRRRLRLRETAARRWRYRRYHTCPMSAARDAEGMTTILLPHLRTEPEKFKNYFRLTIEQFDELLELVKEKLAKSSIREPISPLQRLSVTLRYLCSGSSQKQLSYEHRISAPALCKIIPETCKALWEVLFPLVFPQQFNEELWRRVAGEFEELWDFPHCCGALDGRHNNTVALPHIGSENFNYKGHNSIVVLGLADAKLKFLYVDVGASGRQSDGGILRSSDFGKKLYHPQNLLNLPPPDFLPGVEEPLPYVFVGDEAFAMHGNLMRPYPGGLDLTDEKIIFNYRLSRARRVVENTFGVWTARFRILRNSIHTKKRKTAEAILQATIVLHNFIMDRVTPEELDKLLQNGPEEEPEIHLNPTEHEEQDFIRPAASNDPYNVRIGCTDFFIKNPVPWQWKKLALYHVLMKQ